MATPRVTHPLSDEALEQLPLASTPLAAVIVQVTMPGPVARLSKALEAGDVAQELAGFPYVEKQNAFEIEIRDGQPSPPRISGASYVMKSGDQKWVANIAPNMVGMTTSAYDNRDDFVERLEQVLTAVERTSGPPGVSRVGVRYINRVEDPERDDWLSKVTVNAQGIVREIASTGDLDAVQQALTQLVVKLPNSDYTLHARWGLVAPNFFIDAGVPASPNRQWLLDIDCFTDAPREFDSSQISALVSDLASRAYRFFRWMLPQESLERFQKEDGV